MIRLYSKFEKIFRNIMNSEISKNDDLKELLECIQNDLIEFKQMTEELNNG